MPPRRLLPWLLPRRLYRPLAQSSGYTIGPAGPADPHNNYVPQAGAVFAVDNAKGQISMCFPDNKDNKVVVICTPATKLP